MSSGSRIGVVLGVESRSSRGESLALLGLAVRGGIERWGKRKARISAEILALLSWVVALPTYERKTGLKPATLSLEG